MGKGGQNVATGSDTPLHSWEEVKKHTARDDKWIVINKNVYNITNWQQKHPGGRAVIGHYAGQDATEAFRAFHNDLDKVEKYMKPIHIGRLQAEDDDKELKQDFEDLRQKAHNLGFFKPSVVFFTLMVGHLVVLEALTYYVLYHYGSATWTPWLIAAGLQAVVQTQLGWLQHDFGHLSVFKQTRHNQLVHTLMMSISKAQASWIQHDFGHQSVFSKSSNNKILHRALMCCLKGAGANWWNHMHYQHHAKPNVMDKDPDVRLEALFVLGDTMAKKQANSGTKTLPYNHQHKYFFATLPPLLFPIYFQIMLFRHHITRRAWVELMYTLVFYVRFYLMYNTLLGGFWSMIKWHFFFRVIESHWFVWVSQSNHIPMSIEPDQEKSWVRMQLAATCDVEKSPFNDWFTGHLNFQIEHHLFPTMPRHNYYKVAPLVKSLCKKHDIPYIVKPMSTAFADIVRALKSGGEVWSHYKEAYHMDQLDSNHTQ